MIAQKLNLLHVLLLLSTGASLYYVFWENRQRILGLRGHFRSTWFALIAALLMAFFEMGMKQPIWPLLVAMGIGGIFGGTFGATLKLRVNRSWQIPRPAATRYAVWIVGLLALAAATEIGVAAAAPGAHFLRFGAALAAAACAGFLVGSAIAVGVRIWRLLG